MMRTIPSSPIEAIEPDPRREGALRLIIGGRPILSAPAEAVRRERLVVGGVLEPAQAERMVAEADRAAAYRTALRALERRPFAGRDLERRLTLKGHSAAMAKEAVDRAREAGLVDDAKYAQFYVQSRLARGRGPARLRQELLVAGVPKDLIDAAIRDQVDPDSVSGRISALVSRRAAQLKDLPPADRRRRLLAFLARRGYRGPEVSKIVRGAVL